jgi:hypothetical protein
VEISAVPAESCTKTRSVTRLRKLAEIIELPLDAVRRRLAMMIELAAEDTD